MIMTTQEKVDRIISINEEIKILESKISFFSGVKEGATLSIYSYPRTIELPASVLLSVSAKEAIRLKGELGKLNKELNKLIK